MEGQLAAYRAKKAKERKALSTSVAKRVFNGLLSLRYRGGTVESPSTNQTAEHSQTLQSSVERESSADNYTDFSYTDWRYVLPLVLKITLWFCLWKFFIEIGFGAVYFIVSCSYLMYRNTRTGPRETGKLSAYSVFNPNHERLDGTFTAEQFEKELRLGAGSVK
ncbi:SAYSvFN domain-containing protein 1 [Mactra antiquata]